MPNCGGKPATPAPRSFCSHFWGTTASNSKALIWTSWIFSIQALLLKLLVFGLLRHQPSPSRLTRALCISRTYARNVDGAREWIFRILRGYEDIRVIYYHGWSGLGASAVLRSIAEVLPSRRTTPELCFDRIIHIDCSEWKGRRAMQRAIAEELKLDRSVMAILDKQDEDDDFHGVDESSRDEITAVSRAIHQILKDSRFVVVFHNGSDDAIDLYRFGVPTFAFDTKVIWTFRRRLLTIKHHEGLEGKLKDPDLLAYDFLGELSSEEFYALLCEEATSIVTRYPCMRGISPAMVADCCLYELFLHYSFHNSTKFDWAAHASNFWVCDGIMQEDIAREITNSLYHEIRWDFNVDQFDAIVKEFMKPHSFLVIKDDDAYLKDPCHRISITSKNLSGHANIPPETSSFFLAFQRSDSPAAIPNGLFAHSSNLGVVVLSSCAFNFASPPFLHCHSLTFLGLDHCKHSKTSEGEGHTEWACVLSLRVLDLRHTDWDEILSEEKMDLMTNLRELNVEGVRCWQYASQLQGRVPYLHRLRIIKPTRGAEKPIDTSSSFLDKTKLEILDLSGNGEMDILPNSLSKASRLEVLVLDGCNELENVVVPNGLPHLLRSFSFDGYGPTSHWTPTAELPHKNFRPSIVADKKEVKTSKISLKGCTRLENLFLRRLHNLIELDLSGTAIKILDFNTMVMDVPSLKRLFLLGCERLRAIRWDTSGSKIQPDLELLCIDTRGGIECPWPSVDLNKSFLLQVHAIIADTRLAQSLRVPIGYYYREKGSLKGVYFNIRTSSPVYSGVVQLEATCKEKIAPSVPAGQYSDVVSMIGDAPMRAFPQPPSTELDRHIESELDPSYDNLGWLIRRYAESLHVHDVSTSASMPGGYYLRRCHVERCPNLATVFPSSSDNFALLETFWASDLLMAHCIWSKGSRGGTRSFRNLQHLHLRSCPRLQFVVPMWVSSFPSLQTLHIIHCGDLRHVFILDERYSQEIAVHGVAFPKLTTIHLHDLPMLRQICEVKMVAPALETIKIRGCCGLRRLPAMEGRGEDEKKPTVEIEKDVWDALEWDGVEAGHHPNLFEAPHHSLHYKKKLSRVSVLR